MNIQCNIFGGLTVYCFTDQKISYAWLTSGQCWRCKRVLIAQSCLDTGPELLDLCAVVEGNHRAISRCDFRLKLSNSY